MPESRATIRRALRRPSARFAALLLLGIVAAAALAPLVAPFDPARQLDIVALAARAPSAAHPLGTDAYSRDVLSRVLYGGRVSLAVAFLAVLIASTVGLVYGAVAGFFGGIVDAALMRILDAFLAVPRVLLLLAVLALRTRVELPMLVLLIGLTGWFGVARLVRAEALAARQQPWLAAARALGAGNLRLLGRHVLPNVIGPVVVAATLGIGNAVALEAGLSYLGIGVRPPQASWGNIIQEASANPGGLWWMVVFPGFAIVGTVLASTILGDALRDALDPRQLDRDPD
jgi:peptide/nickel transport system permease protein